MKYKKLEVEDIPQKQKLFLYVAGRRSRGLELSYVKQIGNWVIAQGNPPLVNETYVELLLLACYTFDKKSILPGKQKRAVYASEFDSDNYSTKYKT
jgi:hypothetical protein